MPACALPGCCALPCAAVPCTSINCKSIAKQPSWLRFLKTSLPLAYSSSSSLSCSSSSSSAPAAASAAAPPSGCMRTPRTYAARSSASARPWSFLRLRVGNEGQRSVISAGGGVVLFCGSIHWQCQLQAGPVSYYSAQTQPHTPRQPHWSNDAAAGSRWQASAMLPSLPCLRSPMPPFHVVAVAGGQGAGGVPA